MDASRLGGQWLALNNQIFGQQMQINESKYQFECDNFLSGVIRTNITQYTEQNTNMAVFFAKALCWFIMYIMSRILQYFEKEYEKLVFLVNAFL